MNGSLCRGRRWWEDPTNRAERATASPRILLKILECPVRLRPECDCYTSQRGWCADMGGRHCRASSSCCAPWWLTFNGLFFCFLTPRADWAPKRDEPLHLVRFSFFFFRRAARKREKKTSLNTSEIRVSLSRRPLLLLLPGHSGILLFYFFFSLFAPLPVFHLLVIQETSEKRWLLLNRKSYTPRQHK